MAMTPDDKLLALRYILLSMDSCTLRRVQANLPTIVSVVEFFERQHHAERGLDDLDSDEAVASVLEEMGGDLDSLLSGGWW